MGIVTLPLFGFDPDPSKVGICDKCGALTDDPDTTVCDDCWDMNQEGQRFSAPE